LLFGSLQAQSAPDPARIKAIHDQIQTKVLDPANLAALGKTGFGCRADEEGTKTNDFSTASRGAGVTSVNPTLQSPVTDINPIPDAERAPRYFSPEQRKDVSAFTFVDQNGAAKTVAGLNGKTVVVFLFKPDCKYTADMMGEIIRLHTMQKGKAYEVVAVTIGSEGWGGLSRWRQQNMNILTPDFSIYHPGTKSGTGTSIFGELLATPTTLIVDRHGRVAWRLNGAIRGAVADRLNQIMLEGLLETLPVAAK
jgi:hypothetical protein